jgi:hypothetical protein
MERTAVSLMVLRKSGLSDACFPKGNDPGLHLKQPD